MSHRILVTGASGFIGQALTAKLAKANWAVNVAVRRSGKPSEFVVGNIDAQTKWAGALQGCRTVVHLAARVHVMRDEAVDPLAEFRKVNVEGTLNLARQAAEAGVRRFIFLSTIKVNGESSKPGRPFLPDDVPAPEDAYGISKLEAERGLQQLCAESGMELVVIRPPLVYGPGVGGNFRAMVHWVRRGIPLPLGAIDNRRSLVALDNLVDLIEVCLTHPAAANQVFLAADGEEVSTTELLLRIAHAWGGKARLLPVPPTWLRCGAAMLGKAGAADRLLGSLEVDSTKARDLLDWRPVVSMSEQLGKMTRDDSRS